MRLAAVGTKGKILRHMEKQSINFKGRFELIFVNDAYCTLLETPAETLLGQSILDLFPGEAEREKMVADVFERALSGEHATIKELHYPIGDPADPTAPVRDMWWSLNCAPLPPDPVHGPIFLVHLEDVTSSVTTRMRRDTYASELQHRIGNVLTLVQIIARKTARTSSDLDDFSRAYEARIKALGKTHAFLSGAHWDGMTVRQIIDQQIQIEGLHRSDAIQIEGPEWRLSVLHAQTFAMAVHELVSNAATHGALAVPGGQIYITWDRPDDGSYNFIWKETGSSGLTAPEKPGFGLQMLDRLLPEQLGGRAVMAFTPTGFHYMLVVPENVSVPVARTGQNAYP